MYEGLYQPAIRIVINEIFPTGKYQKLNPNLLGLDATGLGTYQTQFGFRISKIILWKTKHPMQLRGAYSIGFQPASMSKVSIAMGVGREPMEQFLPPFIKKPILPLN